MTLPRGYSLKRREGFAKSLSKIGRRKPKIWFEESKEPGRGWLEKLWCRFVTVFKGDGLLLKGSRDLALVECAVRNWLTGKMALQ